MKGIFNAIWLVFYSILIFILCTILGKFISNVFLGVFFFIIILFFYYYYVFRNSEKRIEKAFINLRDILMNDESILVEGIDKRIFALFNRRQAFAITNSRVIKLERPLLGGYKMIDFQWKDLKDAQISENVFRSICGSTLSFESQDMKLVVYPDSKISSKAYKIAQQQEQAWEEKRRIRNMEEKRAEAGGIMIGQSNNQPSLTSKFSEGKDIQYNTDQISEELLKLKDLLDKGILSDAEFQEMKSKILSRSTRNF